MWNVCSIHFKIKHWKSWKSTISWGTSSRSEVLTIKFIQEMRKPIELSKVKENSTIFDRLWWKRQVNNNSSWNRATEDEDQLETNVEWLTLRLSILWLLEMTVLMFVLKWSQKLLLYTCNLRPPLRLITVIFHIITGQIRGNSPIPADGMCSYIKFAKLVFKIF